MLRLLVYFFVIVAALTSEALCIDFSREVKPILQKHCFECHGAEKQKSGYRLDVREIAFRGGETHAPNIVPGKPEGSPLLRFISGSDEEMRMPPKGPLLSTEEQQILSAWISAGAMWPEADSVQVAGPTDWWSLKPLRRPELPVRTKNPVDAFVQERLQRERWTPSPAADRATLCRRVFFDLTGLPPSPEALDAFVGDQDPNAYEKLVDQLLASPRYGERWARHWLDVVHYGDTHGYDKDKPRLNAWPYRDYVIRSFNEDKPYAQFVREQIAGDVFFPGSTDGIEALGFLAAGPWDYIGHAEVPETKTDGKIARHLDRDDMVSNTLGTFCATTIHCAQCHNHKFDPITQEDYYSLQAVYAAIDRTDKKYFNEPSLTQKYEVLESAFNRAKEKITALEKRAEKDAGPALAKIDEELTKARKAKPLFRPESGYHSQVSSEQDATKWVQLEFEASHRIEKIAFAGCHDDFNKIGAGFGFPLRYKIEISEDPDFKRDVRTLLDRGGEDQPNPGIALQSFKTEPLTGRFVRFTATKLAPRKGDFIFALAELFVFDATGDNIARGARVSSLDSIEAAPRWSRRNLIDGYYAGMSPEAGGDAVAKLESQRVDLLNQTYSPQTLLRLGSLKAERTRLENEIKAFPAPKVAYVGAVHTGTGTFRGTGNEGGKPRPVFVLARGQVTQPVREAQSGALSVLTFRPSRFPLNADVPEGQRRAALADWIADPENPLTWRTMVNRVWQYHFGTGLVETPGDFGRNGGKPSHPELLDWLSAEFRDQGGSLKALHRLIVTSDTYRQSSAYRPEMEARDASNRLLWRQNRRKLEAEAIRDTVLAASDKLDLTMGGPGWRDFVIEHPEHSPHYLYGLHDPQDTTTFRRSVYRFIVRSQTQPWMTSLDCADPSMRVDRRNESLSPLQALALLNNGFLLTQAEALAQRVESEIKGTPGRVARAFRLALSREPTQQESEELNAYASRNGLAQTCRIIFNLNEFSFVD